MVPSKAPLSGPPLKRILRPEVWPDSARGKSAMLRLASTVSSCQEKWPVAAKLLAIEGQASESSTPSSVSVSSRAGSRIAMTPSLMRISENESTRWAWSASGCRARARVSTSGDQLVCPSAAISTAMCGLTSVMSEISMRPDNSGIRRKLAVNSSTATAGPVADSPSTTSANVTVRAGNTDMEIGPRSTGSRPVIARISVLTASLTVSTGITCLAVATAAAPATTAIAIRRNIRFKRMDPIFTAGAQTAKARPEICRNAQARCWSRRAGFY